MDDIRIPLKQGAIRKSQVLELGELLLHPEKLSRSEEKVTLFKLGGIAALDGAAVEYLMSRLLYAVAGLGLLPLPDAS